MIKDLLNVSEEGMKRFGSCSPFFHKAYEAAIARSRARETQIRKLMSRNDATLHLGSGVNRHLAYPFAHAKYPSRDNNVIEAARDLFRKASSNCIVSHSSMASPSEPSGRSSNVLGVFATRDIV